MTTQRDALRDTFVTRRTRRRLGHTLAELLIATTSATLLMGGLSSVLFLAGEALAPNNASLDTNEQARVLATLRDDLRHAMAINELPRGADGIAHAITFTVPDRGGDGLPETIRYAWGRTPDDPTAGDPLLYEYADSENGSDGERVLLEEVQQFDLDSLTRVLEAEDLGTGGTGGSGGGGTGDGGSGDGGTGGGGTGDGGTGDGGTGGGDGGGAAGGSGAELRFVGVAHSVLDANGQELTIPVPSGGNGDLLIAAVAFDGRTRSVTPTQAGWQELSVATRGGSVTLGVWWKIATAADGLVDVTWTSRQQAVGWVMRFDGHAPVNPIHFDEAVGDDSITPTTPDLDTSIDGCLVLRIGAFDADDITLDDPGVADHDPILMKRSNTGSGSVSGGAAYQMQTTAGLTGEASFTLTDDEQSRLMSIAIAPE